MARKRRYEDPDTWRRRIKAWKSSGLSVTEFAEQEGLCKSTFLRWRQKLGENNPKPRRARSRIAARGVPSPSALSFVEVATASQAAGDPVEYGAPFEVGLRSGRRLLVPASFNPEALTRLVAILEGR